MKRLRILCLAILISVVTQNSYALDGCSSSEEQVIYEYYQVIFRALRNFDLEEMLRASQRLSNNLSYSCTQMLQKIQMQQILNGNLSGRYQQQGAPQVLDHGGGTYSSLGVTCTPSGCY